MFVRSSAASFAEMFQVGRIYVFKAVGRTGKMELARVNLIQSQQHCLTWFCASQREAILSFLPLYFPRRCSNPAQNLHNRNVFLAAQTFSVFHHFSLKRCFVWKWMYVSLSINVLLYIFLVVWAAIYKHSVLRFLSLYIRESRRETNHTF